MSGYISVTPRTMEQLHELRGIILSFQFKGMVHALDGTPMSPCSMDHIQLVPTTAPIGKEPKDFRFIGELVEVESVKARRNGEIEFVISLIIPHIGEQRVEITGTYKRDEGRSIVISGIPPTWIPRT